MQHTRYLPILMALTVACAGTKTMPTTMGAKARGHTFEISVPNGFAQAAVKDPEFEILRAAGGVILLSRDSQAQIGVFALGNAGLDPNHDAAACKAFGARWPKVALSSGLIRLGGQRVCRLTQKKNERTAAYTILSRGGQRWIVACHHGAKDPESKNACDSVVSSFHRKSVATPMANPATPTVTAAGSAKPPRMAVYIMSKCPFGVRAMTGISGMLKAMGPDAIDLSIDYIVSEQEGKFISLHGQPEVEGNIVQLCVRDLYPQQKKWLPFFDCVNKRWHDIPQNWKSCAKETALDETQLDKCISGKRGTDLLRASSIKAEAAGAKGSPTITIEGVPYRGNRRKSDFLRSVCRATKGAAAAACKDVKPAVQVRVTILNDLRCKKKCDTIGLESNLRGRFFPAMVVKRLDYGSPEGKALYRRSKLKGLPAVLLGPKVVQTESYPQITRWLDKRADGYLLRIPTHFDPTAEICDNAKDDTGNGRIDCQDTQCKAKPVCRKEKKRHLSVFVMSQCPFGVRALNSMQEVLKAFGKRLRFQIHYIAEANCTTNKAHEGICALHGASEVKENMRQLCAKKYYHRDNKYLDYIWCRNKNYRSDDWRACAVKGIRARTIERCMQSGLGKKLLLADLEQAKALQVTGSPTWLGNNRHLFSGISAQAIQKHFCKHNPKTKGCEKTLSAEDTTGGGSCGN